MPRNPGNRHRDIKIYPDANLKFVRMEFTENKKINLKEKGREEERKEKREAERKR